MTRSVTSMLLLTLSSGDKSSSNERTPFDVTYLCIYIHVVASFCFVLFPYLSLNFSLKNSTDPSSLQSIPERFVASCLILLPSLSTDPFLERSFSYHLRFRDLPLTDVLIVFPFLWSYRPYCVRVLFHNPSF